jgi:multisubunit Na+/H+ antiporter MnhF subunit
MIELNLIEQLAAIFMALALLLGMIRLLAGPAAADRVISADTLSVTITAGLVALAAYFGSALYLDVALVFAALAFIGTVAIAMVIRKGVK